MSAELTKEQRKQIHNNMEKSKLAKMKYTLEDIKEINPVVGCMCIQFHRQHGKEKKTRVPDAEIEAMFFRTLVGNFVSQKLIESQAGS